MLSFRQSIVILLLITKAASLLRPTSDAFPRYRIVDKRFDLSLDAIANLPNHRFWTQSLKVQREAKNDTLSSNVDDSLGVLQSVDLSRVEMGILFSKKLNAIVPIHDGKLQVQHTASIPEIMKSQSPSVPSAVREAGSDADDIFLCAFSPRASHVCVSPSEEERPIDMERLNAVNAALDRLAISTDELLSDKLAGTPPARIYRSFVSPRPKAVHILEPVERAANRTAAQIELALRQLRADDAAYLRNTDRAPADVLKSVATTNSESPARTLNPLVLVLDNIRSAFNVGSMFRTGETAGVTEIVTCGITATPPHPKLRKTAFSAVDTVPCRHFDDIIAAITSLKESGHKIVVMETTSRSQVYTDIPFADVEKVALVVGNEVTGVDTRVMEMADIIAEIPTFGIKNSLNVASAAPIMVFEVLRQWSACGRITTKDNDKEKELESAQ